MQSSFKVYSDKVKRRVITHADDYIPLGFKLGDFCDNLKVSEEVTACDDDIAETITVVDQNVAGNEADAVSRPSTAETLTETIAQMVFSEKMNQEARLNTSSQSEIIEMIIPRGGRILDETKIASGLSLLNLSLNSDIVTEGSTSRLISDALVKLVEGIGNEKIYLSLFASLSEKTKCEIMSKYLQDDHLVSTIKLERSHRHPAYGERSQLDSLVMKMVQLAFMVCRVIYLDIFLPLCLCLWDQMVIFNREWHVVERLLKLLVGWIVMVLSVILQVIFALRGTKKRDVDYSVDRYGAIAVGVVNRVLERLQ